MFYTLDSLMLFAQRYLANLEHITATHGTLISWWRREMKTFSALLALCAENSSVTGEFPLQRPVTRSIDVLFDLRLNQQLSKQWRRRWCETPLRSLWRHCNILTSAFNTSDLITMASIRQIIEPVRIGICQLHYTFHNELPSDTHHLIHTVYVRLVTLFKGKLEHNCVHPVNIRDPKLTICSSLAHKGSKPTADTAQSRH